MNFYVLLYNMTILFGSVVGFGAGAGTPPDMTGISSDVQSVIIGLLSGVGGGFALWGGIDVATGFSQHNAAKQEAGIPKVIGGIAVIAMAVKLVPKIFAFLNFG